MKTQKLVWLFPLAASLLAGQEAGRTVPAREDAYDTKLTSAVRGHELSLAELTRRAGMIFTGTVTRIEMEGAGAVQKPNATSAHNGTVRVTFKVMDGVRCAKDGETITIQVWRGLWTASANQRYRVGETVMVFFHTPSPLGLTSPVGGEAGKFAVLRNQQVEISPERQQTLMPRALRLRPQDTQKPANQSIGQVPYREFLKTVKELTNSNSQK